MNGFLRQLSEGQLTAGFILVLGRIGPLFVLAPLFSSRMLPARARLIAALALSFGIAPLAMKGHKIPLDATGLGGLMLKEILVGLAFAFAVGVVLAAVSIAGSFLDTLVGYAFGSLVDPITGNNNAVLAQAYGLIGVMIFIAIGGDALVIKGLARTYDLVPLVAFPSLGAMTEGVQTAFVGVFASALELVAPVILALVITDVAFGLMARVVPQLNVFAVGVVMAAVSIAGSFLDTLVGYAFGSLVDPLTGNNNAVLAQAYGLIGVIIFIAIGGDALVIQGMARTYDLVPLVAFPSIGIMTEGVLEAFVGIFASALELAAPVILALVITDVAFGLMARVVPQLNVFAVGFPAKIIIGLVIIAASLPFTSTWIGDAVNESLDSALRTLKVL